MNDEREEVGRLLREATKKQRGYADYFGWPDRPVMERGVVGELFAALKRDRGASFANLCSREPGQDPPDCEATDSSGALVGIEVTELVDEGAIHEARKCYRGYCAEWPSERVVAAIQERILRKGKAQSRGGPYARYLLVIHTDEPAISRSFVEQCLAGRVFSNAGIITEAWLLLSYEPGPEIYPYMRLSLGPHANLV